MKYKSFSEIERVTPIPGDQCDLGWNYLPEWIDKQTNLDLNPDFQRGHIWSLDQKMRFIEFCLRGGDSARNIYFNGKGYSRSLNNPLVIVDGKQRLNAVLSFVGNDFPVFGDTFYEDLLINGRFPFDLCISFRINVIDVDRLSILKWYRNMNAGGTPHTEEDIDRVDALIAEEIRVQKK